jgi:hypothetical protein
MEPETPTHAHPAENEIAFVAHEPALPEVTFVPEPDHDVRWVFLGPQGLRAGWSVAMFMPIFVLFIIALSQLASFVFHKLLHVKVPNGTAYQQLVSEGLLLVALVAAGAIMARVEGRRLADYNLAGPRKASHFLSGLLIGFAALSALVGTMAWGGWMHFGPVALTGGQIWWFGALWGLGFLCVGLTEEGAVRCYLQFTLTRGINFWWALGLVGAMCLSLLVLAKGQGVWGVYGFAALGLLPCLWLHWKKTARSGFWQAAWVTSTFFGFIHTGNDGENWIGIFAAAAIGFVFCVSVYVTQSAWWAIGCHAAWDWSETFFYGTADSGFAAKGHYLTTTPAGSALYSGGTDGPEGSVLVIPIVLLLLLVVVLIYGRRKPVEMAAG